jgi:hypothetical protein
VERTARTAKRVTLALLLGVYALSSQTLSANVWEWYILSWSPERVAVFAASGSYTADPCSPEDASAYSECTIACMNLHYMSSGVLDSCDSVEQEGGWHLASATCTCI